MGGRLPSRKNPRTIQPLEFLRIRPRIRVRRLRVRNRWRTLYPQRGRSRAQRGCRRIRFGAHGITNGRRNGMGHLKGARPLSAQARKIETGTHTFPSARGRMFWRNGNDQPQIFRPHATRIRRKNPSDPTENIGV